jgi:hypothetical protein
MATESRGTFAATFRAITSQGQAVSACEQVGEDGCLADVALLCRGQQGEPSLTCQLAKVGQSGGPLWIAKLGAIAASEFGIPVEIMVVPLRNPFDGATSLRESSTWAPIC